VLSCTDQDREALLNQQTVCLMHEGKTIATLNNISIFPHRKEERCARQFGLNNTGHPYQKYIHEECGDWLIGGELHVFERIVWNDGLDQYRFTPFELRNKFKEINVRNVLLYQIFQNKLEFIVM
jgi:3'-phosphoadenosine 5'-phosphosulfate synthase